MRLDLIRSKARKLMDQFGLTDWTFAFKNQKRTLGKCFPTLKLITISEHHALHDTDEQIEETIRHEIAHALVPDHKGHGREWEEAAVRAGCKDIAAKCSDPTLVRPDPLYYAVCNCMRQHNWYRKPRKGYSYTCTTCRCSLTPVPYNKPKQKPKGLFD